MVKHAPRHAKVRLAVPTHASLYGTPTRHAFWIVQRAPLSPLIVLDQNESLLMSSHAWLHSVYIYIVWIQG